MRGLAGREIDDAVPSQVQRRKLSQTLRHAGRRRLPAGRRCAPLFRRGRWSSTCGQCDLCVPQPAATEDVTVRPRRRRLGAPCNGWAGASARRGLIVDHLLGKTKEPSRISNARFLSTFGIGADWHIQQWRDLMEGLMFDGLLSEDANDGRPLVTLGDPEAVRAVYRGERRIFGVSARPTRPRPDHPALARARNGQRQSRRSPGRAERGVGCHAVRSPARLAPRGGPAPQAVPPYVIFHDATLIKYSPPTPHDARSASAHGIRRRPRQARPVWWGCAEDGPGELRLEGLRHTASADRCCAMVMTTPIV